MEGNINMKYIAILGSTGSIGTQTLEVVRAQQDIKVTALSAGDNIDLLEQQIREFRPALAAVKTEEKAKELALRISDLNIPVLSGMDGLMAVACEKKAEVLVTAIVGMLGIRPTIAAIEAGKDIALANKETLVTAGHIIMPLAKKCGVRILPVDSEHSAIFQSLNGEKEHGNKIDKILLTASGGPFRGMSREELSQVRLEDALKHPNWVMGRKITIDSATLVNKGLEVMEAKWLFDVELDQIQVVVHPQSVVHSMVEFTDGSVLAQLGVPDMRLPIQVALEYPERGQRVVEPLNFAARMNLSFEAPDEEVFVSLRLAREAMRMGGLYPAALNTANECAVAAFLQDRIRFTDIYRWIEQTMEWADNREIARDTYTLEDVFALEQEIRARLK